jgi:DNA-binding CsgD family transcriptional regulator
MAILLVVFSVISILLILSGLIVLFVSYKKKKQPAPKTLSQALGVDKIEVCSPTVLSLVTLHNPTEPNAYPEQIKPLITNHEHLHNPTEPNAYPEQIKPLITNHEHLHSLTEPNASPEQIKQLITNHERLITLINGVQKINNARKNEQALKTARDLLQTTENYESIQSWLSVKPYIETLYPNFFRKLNIVVAKVATSAATNATASNALQSPETETLTDFEIRVCLLQIFDLTSKEIAQITNRSARTVETTVYKIRKKLSIPTDTRLPDFLKTL